MCREIYWADLLLKEDVALTRERCAALYRKLMARGASHHMPTYAVLNTLVGLAVAARCDVIAITARQLHELCSISVHDARKALATLEKSGLLERLQYPSEET